MSTCCEGFEKDITIPFGGDQENLDDRNRFALEHGNWAHGEQGQCIHLIHCKQTWKLGTW